MNKFIVAAFMLLGGLCASKESVAFPHALHKCWGLNSNWHRWWKPEFQGKYTNDSTCRIGHAQNMSGLGNEDYIVMYQTKYITGQTVKNEHMIRMNKHRAKKGLGPVDADETIRLMKNGCTFGPITGKIKIAYVDNNGNIGYQIRDAHNGEWGCYYEGELFYSMDCGQTAYSASDQDQGTNFQASDVDSKGNSYTYIYNNSSSTSSSTSTNTNTNTNNNTATQTQPAAQSISASSPYYTHYTQTPTKFVERIVTQPETHQCAVQQKNSGFGWGFVAGLITGAIGMRLWDRAQGMWINTTPGVQYSESNYSLTQPAVIGWPPAGNPTSVSGGNAGGGSGVQVTNGPPVFITQPSNGMWGN